MQGNVKLTHLCTCTETSKLTTYKGTSELKLVYYIIIKLTRIRWYVTENCNIQIASKIVLVCVLQFCKLLKSVDSLQVVLVWWCEFILINLAFDGRKIFINSDIIWSHVYLFSYTFNIFCQCELGKNVSNMLNFSVFTS